MAKQNTKKPTTTKKKVKKDYVLLPVNTTDCNGYPIITQFGKEYYKVPR